MAAGSAQLLCSCSARCCRRHASLRRLRLAAPAAQLSGGGGSKDTGVFQRLPMVQPPDEHFNSAMKRARKLKGPPARHVDGLSAELTKPLRKYAADFPRLGALHPFEAALVELTVGNDNYLRALQGVDLLRKKTAQLGKAAAARVAAQKKKKDMDAACEQEVEALRAMFCGRDGERLTRLLQTTRLLRRLPVVDLANPTLALVGAPNVGKSSLVRALSSGKPEVTDTPGLLVRPDEERNSMEKLTLAALTMLPTCALFVIDPTGESGTSVADQILLHEELRLRFPDKQWLIAVSKRDLEMDAEAQGLLRSSAGDGDDGDQGQYCEFDSLDGTGGDGSSAARTWRAIRCSVVDDQGTDALKQAVFHLLERHRQSIQEQQQQQQQEQADSSSATAALGAGASGQGQQQIEQAGSENNNSSPVS